MIATDSQPRVALLVLGMHRSGTSATARVLNLLGAEVGTRLVEPGFDNPRGFWEHATAVEINERLLKALGRTWYDMREMPDGWIDLPAARQAEDEIAELLQQEFAQCRLCVIKDPRICLVAPLWIAALERLHIEPRVLFVARSPVEVVASLHKRNDWPQRPLYLMWAQYVLSAEAGTRRCPRTLITFDQLLEDWRDTLARVARDLRLRWPIGVDVAGVSIDRFLANDQRHHAIAGAGEKDPGAFQVPTLASRLYQACVAISRGEDQWGYLATLQSEFATAANLFAAHIDELTNRRWDAEARALSLEATLAASEPAVDPMQAKPSKLSGIGTRLQALDESARVLWQHVASNESTVFDIVSSGGAIQARILALTEQIMACMESASSAWLSEMDRQIERLRDELAAKSASLDHLQQAFEQERALSAQLARQNGEVLAKWHVESDRLRCELAVKDVSLGEMKATLASAALAREAMLASTSWKVTAPLRWLRTWFSPRRLRGPIGHATKQTYDRLPLSTSSKLRFKDATFRILAPLLRNTESYRAWQAYKKQSGRFPGASTAGMDRPAPATAAPAAAEVTRVLDGLYATAAGARTSDYVAFDDRPVDPVGIDVRAIAFYLPQFHPIPENDAWWGRGFTEWTNVAKAQPQFVGHYQPRLPGELGFYDLRVVDVMRRQVELARHYGLQGFCFHYYWFGGRRLLERPLEQFLAHKDIDFPFCICWANENWTRRWDGLDQEVLVAQHYSPEDDLAFITALEPMLRDPRYIRVDGKPLIVLYRPSILPDATATLTRWRDHCRRVGIGEIFLAMVQFDVEDPRTYGFDTAIEFPPHKLAKGLAPINDQLQIVNPEYSGYVIDYQSVVERARQHNAPSFSMIRGVFPSWDNEARKPGRGYTFVNATPERYREWLAMAADYARRHPVADGESLVFINAWNEWGEGAYLEPDRRYGCAYLQATRTALMTLAQPQPKRIVIISHDAHPHGAQYLALHLARVFNETFGFSVDVVMLGEGRLRGEFERWATLHDLAGVDPLGDRARQVARSLADAGIKMAIANTTVSGLFAKTLNEAGLRVIGLVHELPGVIEQNNLVEHARSLATCADRIVFPAEQVRRGFDGCVRIDAAKVSIRPQGLYKLNRYAVTGGRERAAQALRERLNISAQARVILCVGYADHRKGVDLFVEAGIQLMRARPDVHFLWIGHFDSSLEPQVRQAVDAAGMKRRFHFPGIDSETDLYYAGADIYALTSREDPFPSVVLEAFQVGMPVVGFAGAGGFTTLLEQGAGRIVAWGDAQDLALALGDLLDDRDAAAAMARKGRTLVEDHYSFRAYAFDLLGWMGWALPRVSVVVPNYNYALYLPQRIESICRQVLPFYELIVLDDASTDNSCEVLERLALERGIHLRLVRNSRNSGSVFRQWAKGVELARGDLVWIAEADDLSEPDFLVRVAAAMSDPAVVMAYAQSKQIDITGRVCAENYFDYTRDVSEERWCKSYRTRGEEEIRTCLAVKNTLPNASAVLFRRSALRAALDRDLETICTYRIAGDWLTYLAVLERGDVAFVSESLNRHRRHVSSVTLSANAKSHLAEILRVQQWVARRYAPPSDSLRKAETYVRQLASYFQLDEADLAEVEAAIANGDPSREVSDLA